MINEPRFQNNPGEHIPRAEQYAKRGIEASAKATRGIKIRGCADAVYSSDYRVRIISDNDSDDYEVDVKYEGDYVFDRMLYRKDKLTLADSEGNEFTTLEEAAEKYAEGLE